MLNRTAARSSAIARYSTLISNTLDVKLSAVGEEELVSLECDSVGLAEAAELMLSDLNRDGRKRSRHAVEQDEAGSNNGG